jgi:hypothetical protein
MAQSCSRCGGAHSIAPETVGNSFAQTQFVDIGQQLSLAQKGARVSRGGTVDRISSAQAES